MMQHKIMNECVCKTVGIAAQEFITNDLRPKRNKILVFYKNYIERSGIRKASFNRTKVRFTTRRGDERKMTDLPTR